MIRLCCVECKHRVNRPTDHARTKPQLRTLRAFRFFRLLGRLRDLKKIVTAVVMSIVPTLQALVKLAYTSIVYIPIISNKREA